MRLTAAVQMRPTAAQASALRETLERANAAANAISTVAWREQSFGQYALHHLAYYDVRAKFDLSAQVVVRVISKVADAYKLDRKKLRKFHPLGSVAYDHHILRWLPDEVSIWTVAGRQRIAFVCGEQQRALLAHRQGESDLVYRDGRWYLYATVDVVEEPGSDPYAGFVGVDLGIANIATSDDGTRHSGTHLNRVRHKSRHLRAKLQRKRTKSATRLLKKRSRKESRFARDVNHCISKRIVAEAQRTGRGIALEDLEGIRNRVRLRRPLPKRRGRPLRSAPKPCVRRFTSHGSSILRSFVIDTLRCVFRMPLVMAMAVKGKLVA